MIEQNTNVKFPFTQEECGTIEKEGWGIFAINPEGTSHRIERYDEAELFLSDREAWNFVIKQAFNGNELHQRAIAFIKSTSINEFNDYVKDADVIEVDSLNDDSAATFSHPWLLQFPNGEALEFNRESEACEKQRSYRFAVSLCPVKGE